MTRADGTHEPAAVRIDFPLNPMDALPFHAPWALRALAIVLSLQRQGLVGRAEWAEALGAERRRDVDAGAPDSNELYYISVCQGNG